MKIRDLARQLRVSPATVSRALNSERAHLVEEVLRRRIQAHAAKVHYQPNQLAQNLARGRSQTIGVILYYVFQSPFFDDYLAKAQCGIYSTLDQFPAYGCKMMLLPKGKSLSDIDHHIIGSGVDGILISTICDFNAAALQELAVAVERRWHRPVVALHMEPRPGSRISTVSFSNEAGAYQAVSYLLQRGYRDIGLIALNESSPDFAQRFRGFQRALREHHAVFRRDHMVAGDSTVDGGYRSTIELFKRAGNKKLSALFCMNDEMALGAQRALRALGKACPQNVALMGFDGLSIGDFTTPRLTTMLQPSFAMAKAGTQLLIDLISGRAKGPLHLDIPSQLLIRESA